MSVCTVTYQGMPVSSIAKESNYKKLYGELAEYYEYLGEEYTIRLAKTINPMVRMFIHNYIDKMLETANSDEWKESYVIVQDEFGNIVANKKLLEVVPSLKAIAGILDRLEER